MSPGACRALVAVLLPLVATASLAMPAAAASERLRETARIRYEVDPEAGTIAVTINGVLQNPGDQAYSNGTWGPLIIEDRVKPGTSRSVTLGGSTDRAGKWRAVDLEVEPIPPGETLRLAVRYTIDGSIDQGESTLAETPARVGAGYLYFCVVGQDVDVGGITVDIDAEDEFVLTQSGSRMDETARGLKSAAGSTAELASLFTCIEGTAEDKLATRDFVGPDDRPITLQAWPELDGWRDAARRNAEPTLDAIRAFLDHPIPGQGPVIIRQAPPRSIGGYASAHDTPGIVQLDESAGNTDAEHQLAHAWFTTDDFVELWMREGLAEWTATAMAGETCAPAEGNPSGLDLSAWQVVQPIADPATIDQVIAEQEAAACGIVSAVAGRMSEAQWREVIGALLNGETKYNGSDGPTAATTTRVDYREWLDAVDERGLVPAAKADTAFAANLDDLDYAQALLADFGIPVDEAELARRSEARASYHQFLRDAAPLGAPLAIRESMDNWAFEDAMRDLDKAYEVLDALKAADELLPQAGLVPLIQPDFEAARNAKALDDVLEKAGLLREQAATVIGPLGALSEASPAGWSLPAVISEAINQTRFEAALAAVEPAQRVVTEVTAADAALPTIGLLAAYKGRFERAASVDELETLAEEAAVDREAAVKVGAALAVLDEEAQGWRIPTVVTAPIGSGRIEDATAVVEDARAVVLAARAADAALPEAGLSEDIRPRFEAVTSAEEMAALRAEAETIQARAETVGSALDSLSSIVPDWDIPAVVTTPIEERDFATAAAVAGAAERWIVNAAEADRKLPDMTALERTKLQFEGAETLDDLTDGADLAEDWNFAAERVNEAIARTKEPRDLLTNLGLFGTDVQPGIDAALAAAIAGEPDIALNEAAAVIDTIKGGASVGGLRIAGIVFFAVALAGIIGMWIVFRRESGPPWARQTKPHWIKDDRKLLGPGKKKGPDNKKK